MNNYKLAKLDGVTITNNKTRNYIFGDAEHFESLKTGEMKYSGFTIRGSKATWNAEHCTVVKHDDYSVTVKVA